jgi:putative FmdB family regulatory protein
MPVYVYRCPACLTEWEMERSIHDDSTVVHAGCDVEAKKIPQAIGLSFKGTGWANKDRSGEL